MTDVPVLVDEPYQSHTRPDVLDCFMRKMLDLEERCIDELFDNQRLVMRLNERNFGWAFDCYSCHLRFKNDTFHNLDHLPGSYRGAAHERCNLLLRKTDQVPVFFHNFRCCDLNLIVSVLRSFPGLDINLIGQGMENYLTLGWGEQLVFKDSRQFLASSL